MRLKALTLAALLGMTGCATIATDSGICASDVLPAVNALGDALLAHPETPGAVAEPATDVVIGIETACQGLDA